MQAVSSSLYFVLNYNLTRIDLHRACSTNCDKRWVTSTYEPTGDHSIDKTLQPRTLRLSDCTSCVCHSIPCAISPIPLPRQSLHSSLSNLNITYNLPSIPPNSQLLGSTNQQHRRRPRLLSPAVVPPHLRYHNPLTSSADLLPPSVPSERFLGAGLDIPWRSFG